jgi:hypothetical protein
MVWQSLPGKIGKMTDLMTFLSLLASKLSTDLEQVDVDPEADEFRLPDPDLPPEDDNQLYDSRRDYFDQLNAYKELRLNINGD